MSDEKNAEDSMGRPKSSPKTRNIKITEEAYESARIASGFTGDSIVDFVSRIIKENAERIIDEQYRLRRSIDEKK